MVNWLMRQWHQSSPSRTHNLDKLFTACRLDSGGIPFFALARTLRPRSYRATGVILENYAAESLPVPACAALRVRCSRSLRGKGVRLLATVRSSRQAYSYPPGEIISLRLPVLDGCPL
jgi:hypothetical protein